MNKKLEEYKFDHFKNIDEVMHYFNYWYKEEDVYSINRYLSLKDFNYISNKYQELQQENQKYEEVIDKAINNSQYWIDYYTRLNSDERIALRLQENIDILKEVK